MYYEKLALEVNSKIAGLEAVNPPVLKGSSGVEHRFLFLAKDDGKYYGFDICQQAGEVEVLRAYIKKIDTGAETFVISLSGRPNPEVARLASEYEVPILNPGEIGNFFSNRISQQIRARKGVLRH